MQSILSLYVPYVTQNLSFDMEVFTELTSLQVATTPNTC